MLNESLKQLKPALILLGIMTLLTGVIYPYVTTIAAEIAFHDQAEGSLIERDGQIIGSELIGQAFDSNPAYFWGRPSAVNYNAAASGGSNFAPTSQDLLDAVNARISALQAADPDNSLPIPVDLVTASGSGLDPHISVAAAEYQISRVAEARGLTEEQVKTLVEEHTEGRDLLVLGEPRVNVLLLNLALDELAPTFRGVISKKSEL